MQLLVAVSLLAGEILPVHSASPDVDPATRKLARSSGPAPLVGELGPYPTPVYAADEAARMPPLNLRAADGVVLVEGANATAQTLLFKGVAWLGTEQARINLIIHAHSACALPRPSALCTLHSALTASRAWCVPQARMLPGGLKFHSIDHYLELLQSWGFNALRLPFDHARMLRNTVVSDEFSVRPQGP